MKIQYVYGDLMSHPGRFILQGCNAQGKMGKGVAKLIRDLYPEVFEQYSARHELKPLQLGEVIPVAVSDGRVILNGITQDKYSEDGNDPDILYADYQAIKTVIQSCNAFLLLDQLNQPNGIISWAGHSQLAMPMIGAGLAHGDWGVISEIIEEHTRDCQPVVYIHERQMYESVMAQYGAK